MIIWYYSLLFLLICHSIITCFYLLFYLELLSGVIYYVFDTVAVLPKDIPEQSICVKLMWTKIFHIICVSKSHGYISHSFFLIVGNTNLILFSIVMYYCRDCTAKRRLLCTWCTIQKIQMRLSEYHHFWLFSIAVDRDHVVLTPCLQVYSFSQCTRVCASCSYEITSYLATRLYVLSLHLCIYAYNDNSNHADIIFILIDDVTFLSLTPNVRYYHNHGSIQRCHLHPDRLFISISLHLIFLSTLI